MISNLGHVSNINGTRVPEEGLGEVGEEGMGEKY